MKYKKEPYINQRTNRSGSITYQVRIRTEDGDVTKSFSEKDYPTPKLAYESAVIYRNKVLYEIATNNYQKKDNRTVQDMFDHYLETTTDSYRTKRNHEIMFNKYITKKNVKIQDLTRADVQEEMNRLVEIASKDTIKRVFAIWKDDIVGTALMLDILQRDVTLGVRKPESHVITVKRGVTTDRDTLFKVEEGILRNLRDHYNAKTIVCMLEVMYYTGMRPAEAEALTRDDISRGYINITKEIGSSLEDFGVVRRCKTETSVRKVPIHPSLKPILDEQVAYARYDEIFKKSDGRYMNTTWVGNIIRNVCKANNIEFNMYRLRHNMATSLVTKQVDTKTTMEILGHANYDMSLYYASSNDDLKKEAVKLLS